MNPKGDIKSLVQRSRKGDVAAMRGLYESHAKEMLATSFRITNDLQLSEDILQESYLDAFQKIHQLKDEAKYKGWLKRIVVNKSLTSIKRRVQYQALALVTDVVEEQESIPIANSSLEKLQDSIQALPEGCRQVFSLFLLDDYKHKEISEILNISVSTSKSQYRYAIKLLREKLSQQSND